MTDFPDPLTAEEIARLDREREHNDLPCLPVRSTYRSPLERLAHKQHPGTRDESRRALIDAISALERAITIANHLCSNANLRSTKAEYSAFADAALDAWFAANAALDPTFNDYPN